MRSFDVDFPLNYQIIHVFANPNVFAICCLLEFASNLSSKSSHRLDVVLRESSYANVGEYNVFLLRQSFIIDLLLTQLTIFCLLDLSRSKGSCRRTFF